MDDTSPILVGAGQFSDRHADLTNSLSPLAMLERVSRQAAEDAGGGDALLGALDACALADIFGWKPKNGPDLLAEALGARIRHGWITPVGGESGLLLLNRMAEAVAAGEVRAGLVAGSNHMASLAQASKEKIRLDWPSGGEGSPTRIGEDRWGTSEREQLYGLALPIFIYPLYENAIRAHRGIEPSEHMLALGRLMSRFTEVASKNPHAWFPTFRGAEEIATPNPVNRMIAWPYPKYMNAVMATDQAAAVIVTSVSAARELGIPEERWVHWRSGGHSQESVWFATERTDFHTSPAMAAATGGALAAADLEMDAIDHFDFYSCFPAAVEMALEMSGLKPDDPRGFTVTGGLPYAGGPGNSYTLHSAAAMLERVRERGGNGLLTGLGWYFTKHTATVLSAEPVDGPSERTAPQVSLAGRVEMVDEANGAAEIETYTVVYGRGGSPKRGIVVGRLSSGERFLANTPEDRTLLESLIEREGVGRPGRVQVVDGKNLFTPS